MKKIFLVLMASLFLLVGCEDDEVYNINQKKSKKYGIEYEDLVINLNDEFSEEKYGKANKYSEIVSCAFEGMDKTYTYDHYEIITYPKDGKDYIYSIYFLDNKVSTKEGIKISDSYEMMKAKYGENYKKNSNEYIYTFEDTTLNFIVENDTIESIEYNYVVK